MNQSKQQVQNKIRIYVEIDEYGDLDKPIRAYLK